ncbi:MAG: hypothetical protein Q4B10_07625 [Actinomycetaceae bacterium]|nr:hypothetical protein [Actinomycetaceae bacterium]
MTSSHIQRSTWPAYMRYLSARRRRRGIQARPVRPDFIPVVVGEDIGAYAMARCLHQSYGSGVAVIASNPVPSITQSRFIDLKLVADLANDDVMRAALGGIVENYPSTRRLLVGTYPGLGAFLARHRTEMEEHFIFVLPSDEALWALNDRAAFAHLCERLDITGPYRQVVDLSVETPVSFDIPFPVIAAPAVTQDVPQQGLTPNGHERLLTSAAEVQRLWRELEEINYRGEYVVWPKPNGDETHRSYLLVYVNQHGHMTMAATTRVLLAITGQHTDIEPVAVISQIPDPRVLDEARKILADIGLTGFATFHLHEDPSSGKTTIIKAHAGITYFSHVIEAGGVNPMRHLVADRIDGLDLGFRQTNREVVSTPLPLSFVTRKIANPHLRERVASLASCGAHVNPLNYPVDLTLEQLPSLAMLARIMREVHKTH